jgi:hypothetical protein
MADIDLMTPPDNFLLAVNILSQLRFIASSLLT